MILDGIKITEDIVANALFKYRMPTMLCACPRAHIFSGESDFLSISSKLLSFDHEIKFSRADYLSEFKKSTKRWKHEYLRNAYLNKKIDTKHCPNHYLFVTPVGMLKKGDPFPHYAGLLEFQFVRAYGYDDTRAAVCRKPENIELQFRVRRKAPLLHSTPVNEQQLKAISRALMWRCFNARAKLVGGFY